MLQRLPKDPAVFRDHADGLDLVDRGWLEDSLELWDRALAADPRAPETPEAAPTASAGLPAPLLAPRTEGVEVAPSEVHEYDGFVPVSRADLRERLEAIVRSVVRADVDVVLPEVPPRAEAVRVYVFRDPVHEALGASGRLHLASDEAVEWRAGVPATILVEVIDGASQARPQIERLVCRVDGSARFAPAG